MRFTIASGVVFGLLATATYASEYHAAEGASYGGVERRHVGSMAGSAIHMVRDVPTGNLFRRDVKSPEEDSEDSEIEDQRLTGKIERREPLRGFGRSSRPARPVVNTNDIPQGQDTTPRAPTRQFFPPSPIKTENLPLGDTTPSVPTRNRFPSVNGGFREDQGPVSQYDQGYGSESDIESDPEPGFRPRSSGGNTFARRAVKTQDEALEQFKHEVQQLTGKVTRRGAPPTLDDLAAQINAMTGSITKRAAPMDPATLDKLADQINAVLGSGKPAKRDLNEMEKRRGGRGGLGGAIVDLFSSFFGGFGL